MEYSSSPPRRSARAATLHNRSSWRRSEQVRRSTPVGQSLSPCAAARICRADSATAMYSWAAAAPASTAAL
eukprot:3144409-Prymnesium_polylepis.1